MEVGFIMGRKSKITYEDKLKACEDYIKGKGMASEIAEAIGVGYEELRTWVNKYRTNGPESLMPKLKNSSYTKEFKVKAVEDYLSGGGSLWDICNKYQIPSHHTLRNWIAKYNELKELEDYIPKPEVYTKMAYRKKTTLKEREEIVKYCIEHNYDYKNTAGVYDVSYSQVYSWVQKYRRMAAKDSATNAESAKKSQNSQR